MKRIFILLVVVASLLLGSSIPSHAQGTAYIVSSTVGLSDDMRLQLNAWLADHPQADTQYYGVTYVHQNGSAWWVSLVGLRLSSPDELWSLEDGSRKAIWIGSVKIMADGTIVPFSAAAP